MKALGTNSGHGQRSNRLVVLETVRLHGPLSRAEVARQTGLSAQTVTNIIDQLKPAGILIERQRRTGSRGQPPIDLKINPEGAYSFGISFDHRRLAVLLVNLGGEIIDRVEYSVRHPSPAVILPMIDASVRQLISSKQIARDRIWGVGAVMPALVANGHPTGLGPSSVPEWLNFPIVNELRERLDLPVFVDNDAAAGAIGEFLYGVGKALNDFFYIYLGVGLGGGIIQSGRPYRGASGMSGELGHVVTLTGGRPCPCGNAGCLERYVSLSSAYSAVTGTEENSGPVEIEVLDKALMANDPRLEAWIEEAAHHLRTAIVMVENLFDPQAVVLGGIAPAGIFDALMKRVLPLPPSVSSRHARPVPRLLRAASGIDTPALGAASLAIFESMSPHVGYQGK